MPGAIASQATNIQFSYHPTTASILNNGHTLQINHAPGSSITLDGQQYELLQFHFHTPSEHQLRSHNFPMEGHLVHKNPHDELAVVGVFIEERHSNPFFQTLAANLPHQANEVKEVHGASINVQDMLPTNQSTYTYSGSLITPPCSQNVKWNVMIKPIQALRRKSRHLLPSWATTTMGHNNRPVQALHSRAVSSQVSYVPTTSPVASHGGAAHWEYIGPVGQRNWADLSNDFTACVDGSAQSPVNLSDPIMVPMDNIQFHYQPSLITVLNNGHTIQANVGQGSHRTNSGQQHSGESVGSQHFQDY